ncbi:MAG TPA: methyltransferase domain-containing protein [Vicinamibacteria bacterium]|nr:methyltransferase domain-containing protein [Vicinamibacteria bacterium]
MAYFSDDAARSIIREAYARVRSEAAAVAEAYYEPDELARLPRGAVELALGVGHPLRHALLQPGEAVLDLGCGAGIDTLLAALAVGPTGRVVGLDMTPEMVERARRHASEMGLANVQVLEGLIEKIPLPDASVDVVVSNGVLNLSTRKSRVLAEAFRVLRPGGRLAIADLVLDEALPEDVLKSPAALAG